jgi:hypothetical protein
VQIAKGRFGARGLDRVVTSRRAGRPPMIADQKIDESIVNTLDCMHRDATH